MGLYELGEWNELEFLADYEDGKLTEDQIVEGFQHLVDNGHAWELQGHYGRTAHALVEAGLVKIEAVVR